MHAGDDDIRHGKLFQELLDRRIYPAACKQRRLRSVGRDELRVGAKRAHGGHKFFSKAAVERAVVAEDRVHDHERRGGCKIAQELPREGKL